MTLKVFHLTESLGGGVLTSIKNLAEVQKEDSCKVYLLFLRRPDTPNLSTIENSFTGVEIIEIGKSSLVGLLRMYFSVIVILLRNRKAIIHAHSSWAGVLVRLANCLIRKPNCYYTPHSYAHLRTDISNSGRRLFKSCEVILNLVARTRVISCGRSEAKIARRLFARGVIESNNFLKDEFLGNPRSFPGKPSGRIQFRVAVVGRISRQKGTERFLRIWENFEEFIEPQWIGNGAQGNLLEQRGVYVSGWLSPKDVATAISNLDALLITSEWEGLSMAGIEALSQGVPIISWSYYGAEDLVVHGYNGFICNHEEEFGLYIGQMFSNPELHCEMKSNARRYFLENFDQKILEDNWKKLYFG